MTEFWESLAEIPAVFLEGYAYAAQTLQDSTASGNPYAAFFVQALTANPFVFYNSNVDSGYSVDNLSPPQPLPFSALYASTNVFLHWVKSRAPDFGEFRLYRGTRFDFVPGPENLLVAMRDTGFVDTPPQTASAHYKLAVVDIHGNRSRFSAVSPQVPVATLASLVSVDARADRIDLTWYSSLAPGPATVYRRTMGVSWSRLGEILADGGGFLHYLDVAVAAGMSYGYRLGIMDGDEEVFAGEIWATAMNSSLALEGARPNPGSRRSLTVWFELPSATSARLELLDLAGRRIAEREVGSLGPGRHAVNLASGARLAPGLYLIRLTQGQNRRTARVAVLD
jgi:hypothetical protein